MFLFAAAFDLQMIESFIVRLRINNVRTCRRVQGHHRSHVDGQRIGQGFLLELGVAIRTRLLGMTG